MNNQSSNFIIHFEKNLLAITNGSYTKMVTFQSAIKQVVQFDKVIVIRIHPKTKEFLNENIFGVSYEGKILWQIQKLKYLYEDSPFTGMNREKDNIKLFNWDGTDLLVNPNTGEIISEGYSK